MPRAVVEDKKTRRRPGQEGHLSPQQHLFVKEYLIDFNGARAVRAAGYNSAAPKVFARELLHRPYIIEAIETAKGEMVAKLDITRETVLAELAKIAFANPMDFGSVDGEGQFGIDLTRASRDQFAAISEITTRQVKEGRGEDARVGRETKIKLADKRAALVDLGRHLGLFEPERQSGLQVTFTIQGPVDPAAAALTIEHE